MEEEIDLRPYFELLLKRWYLILGTAVLAGVVAFVVSSVLPPTYEATTLVAITAPDFRVQFDPRIEELPAETQPLRAYPELAVSDELLQELLVELNPNLGDIATVEELRGNLQAASGDDPTLVRLSVRHGDPGEAANVANTWANLFVVRANEIFGDQGGDQERFFEEQLAEAEVELATAEEALIAFQARNRAAIIDNEMESLNATQANYLADRQSVTFLMQDIRGLRNQLAEDPDGTITFGDQLTTLSLQLKAFNAAFDADTDVPLQLQFNASEMLGDENRRGQIAYLDSLSNTIEEKLVQIEGQLAELEPRILDLQKEKQESETEIARLNRDRDVADEKYIALARKVGEEQITSEEIVSGVRLASMAAVPTEPVSPRRSLNAAVAGALALSSAIFGVLAAHWWAEGRGDEAR